MSLPDVYPQPINLPPAADGAPTAIREALAGAQTAGATLEQSRAERSAAAAEVDQADAVDQAADTAALAAGKPLPERKAGPAARAAFEEAQRRVDAAETGYGAAVDVLTAAMIEGRVSWEAELTAEEQAAIERARETVRTLAATIDELAAIRRLRGELVVFKPSRKPLMAWRGVGFNPGRRRQRTAAQRLDYARAELRQLRVDEQDVDRVLAEVELLATGERPWIPPTPPVEAVKSPDKPRRWVEKSEAA